MEILRLASIILMLSYVNCGKLHYKGTTLFGDSELYYLIYYLIIYDKNLYVLCTYTSAPYYMY